MRILLCLTFLLIGTIAQDALANGVYIPERAELKLPEIPMQRAMVRWRDGEETLVVESALRTESRQVGWILPIPAEPAKLEVADPDMLKSMAMLMQPRVIHDLWSYVSGVWQWAVLILLMTLGVTVLRRGVAEALVLAFFLLMLYSIFLPSLAGLSGVDGVNGVDVITSQRVGDYEATTLRAKDAAAVSGWLKAIGLRELSSEAAAAVESYITRGWCFVVARVAVPDREAFAPSALALTFPVERPVFPMRLTALAGGETRVDLFVVGERSVRAAGFEVISSDAYAASTDQQWDFPVYKSEIGLAVANADAVRQMWDGCVLTHLTRTMGPAEMAAGDVEITLDGRYPVHKRVWTPKGRAGLALIVLGCGTIVVAIGVMMAYGRGRRPGKTGKLALRWLGGVTLASSLGIAVFWPMEASISVSSYRPLFRRIAVRMLRDDVQQGVNGGTIHGRMTAQQILQQIDTEEYERTAGREIHIGRTPGGVAVRKSSGLTFFCIYTPDGGEVRVPLPEPAASR